MNDWEEQIRDELYKLFGMGDRDGSYWHILTRVKEARQVGTLTIDDYKEVEMDDLEELINLIRHQKELSRREGYMEAVEAIEKC